MTYPKSLYSLVPDGDVIKPSDYFGIGSAMDFKYGFEVSKAFNRQNQLKWFQTFGKLTSRNCPLCDFEEFLKLPL